VLLEKAASSDPTQALHFVEDFLDDFGFDSAAVMGRVFFEETFDDPADFGAQDGSFRKGKDPLQVEGHPAAVL